MLLPGPQQTQSISLHTKQTLFVVFDTLIKLLAPIVPLLAEEFYQHIRMKFSCYSGDNAFCTVQEYLFPVTKEVLNKEDKQMWEALSKVQSMVDYSIAKYQRESGEGQDIDKDPLKSTLDSTVVDTQSKTKPSTCFHVHVSINTSTCRDGHVISQLMKQTPGLWAVLSKYFGVELCQLEFVEDGEKEFCQNLKQACTIEICSFPESSGKT